MLPIIDVTALRNGPSRMRDQVDRQIAQACQDTSFFHITNHGVPIDLMRAVGLWRKIFSHRRRTTNWRSPGALVSIEVIYR